MADQLFAGLMQIQQSISPSNFTMISKFPILEEKLPLEFIHNAISLYVPIQIPVLRYGELADLVNTDFFLFQ